MSEQNRTAKLSTNRYFLIGAIFAFLGVVLGAFGAHKLKPMLIANEKLSAWETAVDYQFWHALALLVIGCLPLGASKLLNIAGGFFTLGVIVFSGSLYWLAVSEMKWLGPITPLGGLCFLVGWGALIAFALRGGVGRAP